jgi:hypothetical protein
MSMLACDRHGCSHIMCDALVCGEVCLCDGCLEELVAQAKRWPPVTQNEVLRRVRAFCEGNERTGDEVRKLLDIRWRSEEW